VNGPAPTF
jgi:hypothetical protein